MGIWGVNQRMSGDHEKNINYVRDFLGNYQKHTEEEECKEVCPDRYTDNSHSRNTAESYWAPAIFLANILSPAFGQQLVLPQGCRQNPFWSLKDTSALTAHPWLTLSDMFQEASIVASGLSLHL